MSSEELGEDASAEHLENAQDTIDDAKAAAARAGNLIEDHDIEDHDGGHEDSDTEDGDKEDGAERAEAEDELEVERDGNPEEPAESEGP